MDAAEARKLTEIYLHPDIEVLVKVGDTVAPDQSLVTVDSDKASTEIPAEQGGAAPAVLNAANEIAVAAFLAGKLPFTRIAVMVEQVLSRYAPAAPTALDEVLAVDAEARRAARELMELV